MGKSKLITAECPKNSLIKLVHCVGESHSWLNSSLFHGKEKGYCFNHIFNSFASLGVYQI